MVGYGITERGFSNSLDLDRKSNVIKLKGYNFEMLYGFAEDLLEDISKNKRVPSVEIMGDLNTWGQATNKRKTELYIKYDMGKLINVRLIIRLVLTFYLTGIKFGDGGFAFIVLLWGIVVNCNKYKTKNFSILIS